MRKVLKWAAIVFGGVLGLVVVAVAVLFVMGNARASRLYNHIAGEDLSSAGGTLERGEYLVTSVSACMECHGEGFRGSEFINEPPIGSIPAPNLTSGRGGVADRYTSDDMWERALRHGVGADGRALVIMPSQHYAYLSDHDAASIIVYLKSMLPVDNELQARDVSPVARILLALGAFGQLAVERIDHAAGHAPPPAPGATADYGFYLMKAAVCADCHGETYEGGTAGGSDVQTPSLTASGSLGTWTQEEFIQALRTGVRPNGVPLSEDMPWRFYGRMADDDLAAIYTYLRTLP
jgi:cytochrome c553